MNKTLFETYLETQINNRFEEGAWGYGILDNDDASDLVYKIAKLINLNIDPDAYAKEVLQSIRQNKQLLKQNFYKLMPANPNKQYIMDTNKEHFWPLIATLAKIADAPIKYRKIIKEQLRKLSEEKEHQNWDNAKARRDFISKLARNL